MWNLECKNCHCSFENMRRDKQFCSKECKNDFNKKILKGNRANIYLTKYCKQCLKRFKTKSLNQIYCSKECSKEYHKEKENSEGYLRLRFDVFTRDNFACQYCGRNVIEDKVKLHIDHIKPRSKGGKDVMDNLITSCFECNLGKSDVLLDARILNKIKLSMENKEKSKIAPINPPQKLNLMESDNE